MCISIRRTMRYTSRCTANDPIHSRYIKAATNAIRYDSPLLRCSAIRHDTIRHDAIQQDAMLNNTILCNLIWYIMIYLFVRQQISNQVSDKRKHLCACVCVLNVKFLFVRQQISNKVSDKRKHVCVMCMCMCVYVHKCVLNVTFFHYTWQSQHSLLHPKHVDQLPHTLNLTNLSYFQVFLKEYELIHMIRMKQTALCCNYVPSRAKHSFRV